MHLELTMYKEPNSIEMFYSNDELSAKTLSQFVEKNIRLFYDTQYTAYNRALNS